MCGFHLDIPPTGPNLQKSFSTHVLRIKPFKLPQIVLFKTDVPDYFQVLE